MQSNCVQGGNLDAKDAGLFEREFKRFGSPLGIDPRWRSPD